MLDPQETIDRLQKANEELLAKLELTKQYVPKHILKDMNTAPVIQQAVANAYNHAAKQCTHPEDRLALVKIAAELGKKK